MLPTHTEQFKIWLIQATGSQIPAVPGVSRHVALCRIPWQMLSFPPTFKLWRMENRSATVNHFVHHNIQSDAMETNSLMSCHHSTEEQISDWHYDVMLYSRSSHEIFIQETAKMCNWEKYIDTIFFFVNWENTTITHVTGWNTFI